MVGDRRAVRDLVAEPVFFEDYCIAAYAEKNHPEYENFSEQELVKFVMGKVVNRDDSPFFYSSTVGNPIFDEVRIAVIFYETDVALVMLAETSLICCFVEPVTERTGMAAIDAIELNARVSSKLYAIKNHDEPKKIESLLFREVNQILSNLILEKHRSL